MCAVFKIATLQSRAFSLIPWKIPQSTFQCAFGASAEARVLMFLLFRPQRGDIRKDPK